MLFRLHNLPFIATCKIQVTRSAFFFHNIIPNLLCISSSADYSPSLTNSLNMLKFSSEYFFSTFGLSYNLTFPCACQFLLQRTSFIHSHSIYHIVIDAICTFLMIISTSCILLFSSCKNSPIFELLPHSSFHIVICWGPWAHGSQNFKSWQPL